MNDINQLVFYEIDFNHPLMKPALSAAKQAAVWGTGGGLSYLASTDHTTKRKVNTFMNTQQKRKKAEYDKKHYSKLKKSILAGSLAGAIGTMV